LSELPRPGRTRFPQGGRRKRKGDVIGGARDLIKSKHVRSELPRPNGRGFLLQSPTLPVAFRYG